MIKIATYKPQKFGIRKHNPIDSDGEDRFRIEYPSQEYLDEEDARQFKLEFNIAWQLYCLITDNLEKLEQSPDFGVRNIPIGIIEVIAALEKFQNQQ